ncbi:MAG: hypothetical protein DRJ64_09735 [Thermoprotei archaeon]|nr:MAG: hypothetical protein DRJ64_09735 [Thermoprotei archaeon]
MKIYKFLLLVLSIFLFSACAEKDDIRYAEIERDGIVTSIYYDELDRSVKESVYLKYSIHDLIKKYMYQDGSYLEKDFKYVSNEVYDFLIVVPVKSKIDMTNKFKNKGYFVGYYADYANVQSMNGYYHYKLYVNSNISASRFSLNDVKDQKVYIDYHENTRSLLGGNKTEYTTNKLTIPAEEFEEMLDRLGISNERLEFQPDDK